MREGRVVVICGESYRHRYFANRLRESCNVVGVVSERMAPHLGMGFVRRSLELARGFRFRPDRIYAKTLCRVIELYRGRGVYERILGPLGSEFLLPPGAARLRLESPVNLPANIDRIRRMKPDVIAVSGARLLSQELIEVPRVAALNMHGGLSPYYRGAESVFWALYNREPQFVGVTIHLLTTGIDAGPIVYTARPDIEGGDDEMTLFAKAYRLGCELMIRAVADALHGRVQAVPQWTKGRLYRRRDRNPRQYRELIRILSAGALEDYLRLRNEGEGGVRLIGDPALLAAAAGEASARGRRPPAANEGTG